MGERMEFGEDLVRNTGRDAEEANRRRDLPRGQHAPFRDCLVGPAWAEQVHRDVVPLIGQRRSSLRHLLDSLKKRPVERIKQQTEACTIPMDVAVVLGVPAKSPALRAVYKTFSEDDMGRFYVAICFYPAGRFRLTQTLMRDA